MHFTKDQLDEMQREVNAAPKYTAAPQRLLAATQSSPPSSMSLLSYLPYTPSQRDQGSCGNCWVWASTGAMEISHNINSGISDRLSIQWFDDNYGTGPLGQDSACGGGFVSDFTNWYNTDKTPIPWSNSNAYWGDGGDSETVAPWGPTTPPLSSISPSPYYKLNSISYSTISTSNVGQATAIANIKSALNSNQPVVYTFYLPSAGWTEFYNFWNNYPEMTEMYNPSAYNDFIEDGGHIALIVGYDNSADTTNPYWIVVNSWGAPSNRPDGLFLLNMSMNYDAVFYPSGYPTDLFQQNTFQVLNSVFTPPTVTGISPTAGPTAGGITVNITGININGATAVKFGTIAATSYTINSANSITATTPAGSVGAVDVTVTTPGGTSAKSSADQYTYAPVPTITVISPTAGPIVGNTVITITGTGFTGTTAVTVGGKPASSFKVTSATTITATVPAGSAGSVDITVTTPGGTATETVAYTYAPIPTVTSISQTAGPITGGTNVTITGTGFTGTTAITVGGATANGVTVVNATMVSATTPAHAAGTVDVTVTTPGGTSVKSSVDQYTYVAPPTLTTVTPATPWYRNATVLFLITGTNFEPGLTTINFTYPTNGTVLNITAGFTVNTITATTINGTVVIPFSAPTGSWNASVTTFYGGQVWKPAALTVSNFPAPTITAITPTAGTKNSLVAFTITGTNFQTDTGKTNVTIYEDVTGTELGITLIGLTSTQITGSVTIPGSALSGAYHVNVTTTDGGMEANPSTPVTFAVGYLGIPTLGITPLNQTSGYLNSTVAFSITGSNFEPGLTTVAFSNLTVPGLVLNTTTLTNVTGTKITGTIMIPNNAPTGPYRLDISTADGGVVNKINAFTVNAVPAPTITSIIPVSGYQNSTVGFTIAGTNFETGPGQTTVAFVNKTTGLPLNSTVGVNTVTATGITGTMVIPFNAPTGTWNVSVTTVDGGTAGKPSAFTVNAFPAPTITAITPATGTKNSTVLFTLTGTNFEAPGTSVSIFDSTSGTVLGTTLYNVTSTKVIGSIAIPSNVPAGLYTLQITTVDGGAVTRLQAFTVNYLPLPSLGTLTPATGSLNTTVPFTLTGNYFQPSGGTTVMLRMVGTTLPASLTLVNTTTVQGSFAIPNTAGTGSYILYVITTGGGFNSKPNAFTVTPFAKPTITAVTPATWYLNATVPFLITGTNFEPGLTTVAFDYPSNSAPLNSTVAVNAVTAMTINGVIVVPSSVPTGAWNVSVTTVDGGQVWKSNAISIV
jgi:hypothetical protein